MWCIFILVINANVAIFNVDVMLRTLNATYRESIFLDQRMVTKIAFKNKRKFTPTLEILVPASPKVGLYSPASYFC